MYRLKEGLLNNKSLLRIGLQAAKISDEGKWGSHGNHNNHGNHGNYSNHGNYGNLGNHDYRRVKYGHEAEVEDDEYNEPYDIS